MTAYTRGYVERDIESERVFRVGDASARGEVLYIDPTWVIMRYQGKLAYVKRHRIFSVTPVDSSTTPPYGTQKHAYVAKTATNCYVRKSMSDQDEDTPIAAYTSYYKMVDTEKNHNRIFNIARGSELISGIYQPGDVFDGNKIMGPYNKGKGYLPAGALSDGTTTTSYGGGTCQVSSTLYNALLQLPGINILYRRAHGENAAPYLPHGVDAAVGNKTQNLRWRNDYDFPIRVEAHTSGDGALCMLIYRVYDEK